VRQAIKQLEKCKADSARGDSFNEGRHLRSIHPLSSLADLTVPLLQNIEKQLKSDLHIVREVSSLFVYGSDACLFIGHLMKDCNYIERCQIAPMTT